MSDEFHISSFIVQSKPDCMQVMIDQLMNLPGVEVHQTSPEGKIVVTLECQHTGEISDTTAAIGRMPGVLSCNMVFHQIEQETDNRIPTHTP